MRGYICQLITGGKKRVYHNAAFPAPHVYSPIKVKSRDLGGIMSLDVFINHAGDDTSVAVEVCALLEKRGLKCWTGPRDVAAGSVWDEAILDAIETSRVFLLILSKSANQSQFVKNE